MVLRIGDDEGAYHRNDPALRAKPGELYNISIDNVYSRAMCAVNVCTAVKNLSARNVYVHSDGGYALFCGYTTLDQVILYLPERQEEYDAIKLRDYDSPPAELENIQVENVYYTANGAYGDSIIRVWNANLRNVSVKNVQSDSNVPLITYAGNHNGTVEIL
jgi:hypothetical protein